jgi:hypothetical protein
LETVDLPANGADSRSYYANLDAFAFAFTTTGTDAPLTEVSIWGKDSTGQLVDAHRLVTSEILNEG